MPVDAFRLGAGLGAVGAVTLVYVRWLHVSNAAMVSTTFLLIVLLVAAASRFWVAAATSIAAMICFNFFFLPPVGTLIIAQPENWVALVAFLVVSLVASKARWLSFGESLEAADAFASDVRRTTATLDRFLMVNAQIVGLSRRNSNVRSLALSMNQKRTLTAACEDTLHALQEALANRGSFGTRRALAPERLLGVI